jgi:AraC-like DNA-binding protein
LSIAAFLPYNLLTHVQHVFEDEEKVRPADSWDSLESLIRENAISVAIVDPAASGAMNVDAVARILARYPSLPIVAYVSLSPASFGAIAQLSRRGLEHVVLHQFDDSKIRFQQRIKRVQSSPLVHQLLAALAPKLRQMPLPLARTVRDVLERPHRFGSALDVATSAGIPATSLYRSFESAGLGSPKRLLIAAKVLRGLSYLRDPGYSVRDVAKKLGYRQSRIFTAHMVEIFGFTPSRIRPRITEEDALEIILRWAALSDKNSSSSSDMEQPAG